MDRPNGLRDQILFLATKISQLENIIEDMKGTIEHLSRSRSTAIDIIDSLRSTVEFRQLRVQQLTSTIASERRRHEANMEEMSEIVNRHVALIDQLTSTIDNHRLRNTETVEELTSNVVRLQQRREEVVVRLQQRREELATLATLAKMSSRRIMANRRRMVNSKFFKAEASRYRTAASQGS